MLTGSAVWCCPHRSVAGMLGNVGILFRPLMRLHHKGGGRRAEPYEEAILRDLPQKGHKLLVRIDSATIRDFEA